MCVAWLLFLGPRNNLTAMITTALAEVQAEAPPPVTSEAASSSSSIGDSADADALSALSDIPESEQLPMSAEAVSSVRPAVTSNTERKGLGGSRQVFVQPPSALSQH